LNTSTLANGVTSFSWTAMNFSINARASCSIFVLIVRDPSRTMTFHFEVVCVVFAGPGGNDGKYSLVDRKSETRWARTQLPGVSLFPHL
jgi:hypothetical protein